MFERVLLVLGPFLAPLAAAALNTSRRNRLRRRVNHYLELADALRETDPEREALVRDLVAETVESLVVLEQRALRRRIDPAGVVTLLVLVVPMVALLAWAWTWDDWWKWPTIVFAVLWTLVWGGVGLGQVFKTHENDGAKENGPAAT